jgi:geranylgeranyl diphosphate synthase type I
MDEDKLRRGLPTTQEYFANGDKHYGEGMAVMTGDAVLLMGYQMILESGFESDLIHKVMKQVLRGVTNTALGQAYDVSLPKLGEITEDKVLALHFAKTALYTYENPLLSGALLSKQGPEVIEKLKKYAEYGGVAFQLQDDILGLYGDPKETGKSSDSDLLQGKVTLLIVEAMEKASKEEKRNLKGIWGNREASRNELDKVKEIIKKTGAYDSSKRIAVGLAEKAVIEAQKLRKMGVNTEAIDFIEGISAYMVEREV